MQLLANAQPAKASVAIKIEKDFMFENKSVCVVYLFELELLC